MSTSRPTLRTRNTIERLHEGFRRQHKLPTVSGRDVYAIAGGLVTYGPNMRASYRHLASYSTRREVVWISNRGPGIIPEISALAPPSPELRFLLGRTRFTDGRRHDELLALAHPHGAELAWR